MGRRIKEEKKYGTRSNQGARKKRGPATQSQSWLWLKRERKITEARKEKMPEGRKNRWDNLS